MIGKTAFITGASRGIGRACAITLAAAGVRVIVAARALDKLEEVAAEIRSRNGQAEIASIDLASPDSIKQAFAKSGPIDILVNNAAITKDNLALRMKKDDWDSVIQTNLTGAFLCMQHVLQPMMR